MFDNLDAVVCKVDFHVTKMEYGRMQMVHKTSKSEATVSIGGLWSIEAEKGPGSAAGHHSSYTDGNGKTPATILKTRSTHLYGSGKSLDNYSTPISIAFTPKLFNSDHRFDVTHLHGANMASIGQWNALRSTPLKLSDRPLQVVQRQRRARLAAVVIRGRGTAQGSCALTLSPWPELGYFSNTEERRSKMVHEQTKGGRGTRNLSEGEAVRGLVEFHFKTYEQLHAYADFLRLALLTWITLAWWVSLLITTAQLAAGTAKWGGVSDFFHMPNTSPNIVPILPNG